jgi:hypothetical protein
VKCIPLDYGADEPLLLEVDNDALVADCRGPEGVAGEAARQLVEAACSATKSGPPLESHVVPGDRVTIGLAGDGPQATEVVAAVATRLVAAGVEPADITVLRGPPLEPLGCGVPEQTRDVPAIGAATAFDPAVEPQTSYMAADEAGRPIHLARSLVDADVVVSIGQWGWDAAFGGRNRESATHNDVRLKVHHVGLDLVEDSLAVLIDPPRKRESKPVVWVPTPRSKPVNGHGRTLVGFHRRDARTANGTGGNHVDVVTAAH